MAQELLVEIGTEEVPASYFPEIFRRMEETIQKLFERHRIDWEYVRALGTPRRLVLHVAGLAETQRDVQEQILGPPVRVGLDAEGKPTRAARGFAQRFGCAVDDLHRVETERGNYLAFTRVEEGKPVRPLLPDLLADYIRSLPFPKTMRWADLSLRFVRPIRWLLAVAGGETIPVELDGIRADNRSFGHRFMAPDAFEARTFDQYVEAARDHYVVVLPEERIEAIERDVSELARARGLRVVADAELVQTVAYMVEYPSAVWGSFDPGYLDVPREVVLSALREHQRYFALEDEEGILQPYFIAINNTVAQKPETVAHGHERVLRARLADAMFFFREDTQKPLAHHVERLHNVIFQERVGSVYDKVQRVQRLGMWLNDRLRAADASLLKRAAHLCKADLVTQMVIEFPKLQGVIGAEYARLSGESDAVAAAILEHYLPRSADDQLPQTPVGSLLSIADKLDTVVGCFSAGIRPTGSEDQYGLRRQALGIIGILLERGYRLSIQEAIAQAKAELPPDLREGVDASEIEGFFAQRVRGQLLAEGFDYDLIDAAMACGSDDVVDLRNRVGALARVRARQELEPLTTAFRRVVRILVPGIDGCVEAERFVEPAEKDLWQAYLAVREDADRAKHEEDYAAILRFLAQLRPVVDRYFDEVLVMTEDPALRNNRLNLLSRVAELFSQFADFTRVVVE